jgi:FlaA1/EpsC-like NDP-sugar epimerase
MIPFNQIAIDLLKELGFEPDIYQTEDEAKQQAKLMSSETKKYPVYFFDSDTSGEKSYEEFFTDDEILDNDSFINLGIVKNSKRRSIEEIDNIFNQLMSFFEDRSINKADIVSILKNYLPNFSHVEKRLNLDQKM